MTFYNVLDTPIGAVTTFVDREGTVTGIRFGEAPEREYRTRNEEATAEVDRQLMEYFAKERTAFDVPLKLGGSEFQREVWEQMALIPYGQTRSYGQIARALGNPGGAQAVGQAAGANPIPIVIPCHRVIGTTSALVGFGGGLSVKEQLLKLESGIPASLFD